LDLGFSVFGRILVKAEFNLKQHNMSDKDHQTVEPPCEVELLERPLPDDFLQGKIRSYEEIRDRTEASLDRSEVNWKKWPSIR
jgi:hypothetical protein